MPVRQLGRRHFLLGTGGAVLSIPFLHSLQPRTAHAQAYDQRFFVAFMTQHGGVWPEHMYPGDQALNQNHSLYNDHTMRWGRLAPTSSGGQVSLSPVLTCPSGSMPQSLIDKMMIIRGLDVPSYIGHSSAAVLGNYDRRDDPNRPNYYVPTIDQVLAAWNGFYGAADPYMLKSMHVGADLSWIERSGGIQAMDAATSPDVLFRTVLSTMPPYQPPTTQPPPDPDPTPPPPDPDPDPTPPPPDPDPDPTPPPPDPDPTPPPPNPTPTPPPAPQPGESRTHVLNRVVEHFSQLTTGAFGDARRLSANDKARLNDHMDMVSDLARRFDTADSKANNVAAACDPQAGNTGNRDDAGDMYSPVYSDLRNWHEDYNAVFAAAIACGASRIATVRVENTFHHSSNFTVDWEQWHQPIAHQAGMSRSQWATSGNLPEHPQDTLVTAKNNFYRDGYVDLLNRLDAIDAGDGSSLLDKGLVMWAQESGPVTHDMDSTPIVTAGSVDGYFNTGHSFDLRDRNGATHRWGDEGNTALFLERRPGILYNQWLSNILQSMGMSPSEFQRNHALGWAGYGQVETDDPSWHPSRLRTDANNKIPKVTSGT